ncbi:MAG: translation initiation factor IF-3 [Planctomycetota bacterium]
MDRPVESRGPRINDRIRVPQVRLISHTGEQLGVVDTTRAMALAQEVGLDLVEVSPDSRPPVCKIQDYGKQKYEAKRKKRLAQKKQHQVITKEVRLRPKTGEHDFQVKLKHAVRFLNKGAKVQVNILFRGRERMHSDIARDHCKRIAAELAEIAKVEVQPKMDGYRMIMVLAPIPGKAGQQKTVAAESEDDTTSSADDSE